MTALRIPGCCAFPLASKVGDTYVCITCSTVYRHLIAGWATANADVDLAQEIVDAVNPTLYRTPTPVEFPPGTPEYIDYEARLRAELDKYASGVHPYEYRLDEQERTDQ